MSTPKKPRSLSAYEAHPSMVGPDGSPIHRWRRGDVVVCSSREVCEHRGLLVPQYHVSVSKAGGRADDETVRAVLADFDMEDALEDNHHSGIARNFWLVVGASRSEQECPCKENEETVVESDGFQWQRPADV